MSFRLRVLQWPEFDIEFCAVCFLRWLLRLLQNEQRWSFVFQNDNVVVLTIKLIQIQKAPAFLPLASARTAKNGAAGSATKHGRAASQAPPVNASFPSTPDTQPVLQPCVKQDRLSIIKKCYRFNASSTTRRRSLPRSATNFAQLLIRLFGIIVMVILIEV